MKTVVITGAARGLGHALATEFADRGYRVFGTTRKAEDAARLEQEFGTPHRFLVANSTDLDSLKDLASLALEDDVVDIVIANAGVINARKPAWEIPRKIWDQHLGVNVQGMINTMQAFLPAMIDADRGTFIGISSGWGRSPSQGLAPYCASKFAVEGLISCLVLDLAEQRSAVTAVALDPGGGINTDMLANCLPDEHTEYRSTKDWAPGAVSHIETSIVAERKSGSQEIPENAHSN